MEHFPKKRYPYTEENNVVSSNECTGMAQIEPDEDEAESLRRIYDTPISHKPKKKTK